MALAQNEMKAKAGLPERVGLNEGLGVARATLQTALSEQRNVKREAGKWATFIAFDSAAA